MLKSNTMTFSTNDIQMLLNMDFNMNFFDTSEVLELFDMLLNNKDGIIKCKSLILFKKLILLRSFSNINIFKDIFHKLFHKKSSLEIKLGQLQSTINNGVKDISERRKHKISEMHAIAKELKNMNLFRKFEDIHTYELSVEARIKAKREKK